MSTAIHDDERELWQLLLRYGRVQPWTEAHYEQWTIRDIINSDLIDIAPKRAWYLCEKWSDQGLYEWGTTCDLGWVEECCLSCGWFGGGRYCLAKNHARWCPTRADESSQA